MHIAAQSKYFEIEQIPAWIFFLTTLIYVAKVLFVANTI